MSGFVALAFVVGVLAGAAVSWWFSGRAASTSSRRSHSIKVAALTAVASIVVTLAAVYGVVKWKFRSRPVKQASVQQAVKDFRQAQVAAASSSPDNKSSSAKTATSAPTSDSATTTTATVPSAGVYTYNATGFYQVDAPIVGKERRDLPTTIPGVLVPSKNCWTLGLRFFQQHTWQARYCKPSQDTQRLATVTTANEFFGQKFGGVYTCSPDELVRAEMKPGATWKQLCKSTKKKKESKGTVVHVTFVGDETLTIGRTTVPSRHIRRRIIIAGRQVGETVRDLWFGKTSGLLLRVREKGSSAGMAKVQSDWQLTLASTTPSK